jgi:hypothetical protein
MIPCPRCNKVLNARFNGCWHRCECGQAVYLSRVPSVAEIRAFEEMRKGKKK